MNELLQQRIESVQAGKNITHAQLEAKRSLREQLDSDLEAFLKNGGAVEQLPQGFSGECSKGWSGSKPKSQKTMREVMANSVAQIDKKRARQKEDQAPLAEIKALDQWCKERKGRGGDLCRELKVAHSFISQITNQTRPCSKERYEQIKLAMKAIEQRVRYYDAMQRHIDAWWQGEQKDPETGEHHLAHAICCGMFLWWFDNQQSGVPEAILEAQALRGERE